SERRIFLPLTVASASSASPLLRHPHTPARMHSASRTVRAEADERVNSERNFKTKTSKAGGTLIISGTCDALGGTPSASNDSYLLAGEVAPAFSAATGLGADFSSAGAFAAADFSSRAGG